jgi:hypothetical protein
LESHYTNQERNHNNDLHRDELQADSTMPYRDICVILKSF